MRSRSMDSPRSRPTTRPRSTGCPLVLLLLIASIAAAVQSPVTARPRAADLRRWLQPPPATQPAAPVETFTAADRPLKGAGTATGNLAEWLKPIDLKPET